MGSGLQWISGSPLGTLQDSAMHYGKQNAGQTGLIHALDFFSPQSLWHPGIFVFFFLLLKARVSDASRWSAKHFV